MNDNCPCCGQIFDHPLKLSCGHSICQRCADELFSIQVLKKKITLEDPSTTLKNNRIKEKEKEESPEVQFEPKEDTKEDPKVEDESIMLDEIQFDDDVEVGANGDNEPETETKEVQAEEPNKTTVAHPTEQDHSETVAISCPSCEALTQIPTSKQPKDVLQFDNALDTLVKEYFAAPCGHDCGRTAVQDCANCRISFCQECWAVVHRGNMASHQKLELHELDAIQRCATHLDQTLDLFCRECDVLVCIKCASFGSEHKKHSCTPIEEYSLQLKKDVLIPKFESLKVASKKYETHALGIDTSVEHIEKAHQEIKTLISSEFEKIKKAASRTEEELLSLCDSVRQQKTDLLQMQKRALSTVENTTKLHLNEVTKVLEDRESTINAFKLINMKKHLEFLTEQTTDKHIQLEPLACCSDDYERIIDSTLIVQDVTNLGNRCLDVRRKVKYIVNEYEELPTPVGEASQVTYNADDELKTPINNDNQEHNFKKRKASEVTEDGQQHGNSKKKKRKNKTKKQHLKDSLDKISKH
ncbi:TRIM36 [Acrasis kona]|uniref:TRIM36 n=1 Tax=Acrasis kona TaxID=1008807 RepID=A0AAW2Z716_9EUKA